MDPSEIIAAVNEALRSGEAATPINLPAEFAQVLEQEHPTYKLNLKKWLDIDAMVNDQVTGSVLASFLPRGTDEHPSDYARRTSLANFKGELSPVLTRLVGAVRTKPPTRDEKTLTDYGDFMKNVDGRHTTLSRFMEDRAKQILALGVAPFIVDRPMVGDTGFASEETSMGFTSAEQTRKVDDKEIRLTPYKIHQVINWDHGTTGELHWVRIREVTQNSTPYGAPQTVTIYRDWDRQSWRVFEVKEVVVNGQLKKVVQLVGQGDHWLGMVPMVMPFLESDEPMSFFSPMFYAAKHDIDRFRSDADYQYSLWAHGNPTIKNITNDTPKRLALGPNAQIERNPEYGEDVEYLKIPMDAFKAQLQNKEDSLTGLRRVAGVDTLSGQDDSGSQNAVSGRSRAVSFSISESRILGLLSEALSAGEKRLFEIGERWRSPRTNLTPDDTLFTGETVYPRAFGLSDAEQSIAQWLETRDSINSERFDREHQYKLIDMTLGDISKKTRDLIVKEINANPILGGSAAPDPFEEELSLDADDRDPSDAADAMAEADAKSLETKQTEKM